MESTKKLEKVLAQDTAVVTAEPAVSVADVRGGNPLDLPASVFTAGLERRGHNRKALIAWVRGELVDGVDFGRIKTSRGLSKPSLYKPGAEKICGMLGVTAVFPTLARYEELVMSGDEPSQLLIRCELVNSDGEIVASGAGARDVQQDQNDLNKALKMCLKSAHIDATLRLGGLSEVFTQDIEDMPAMRADQAPANVGSDDVVPGGKHKGQAWADVALDYVQWCVETERTIPAALRRGAEIEFERRMNAFDVEQSASAGVTTTEDEEFNDDIPF